MYWKLPAHISSAAWALAGKFLFEGWEWQTRTANCWSQKNEFKFRSCQARHRVGTHSSKWVLTVIKPHASPHWSLGCSLQSPNPLPFSTFATSILDLGWNHPQTPYLWHSLLFSMGSKHVQKMLRLGQSRDMVRRLHVLKFPFPIPLRNGNVGA